MNLLGSYTHTNALSKGYVILIILIIISGMVLPIIIMDNVLDLC